MVCKSFRIRTKKGIKYGYCTLLKKEVDLYSCKCENTEYKQYKKLEAHTTMKKATYRRNKKEKQRFSIIYQDLTKCCVCGLNQGIEINEVFEGSNRNNSMKYGMCNPMCDKHHKEFHNDREVSLYYKKMFQKKFEETHTREEFISIFKKNYL